MLSNGFHVVLSFVEIITVDSKDVMNRVILTGSAKGLRIG